MIDKKHLLRELEEKFKEVQKELGFETSFEDLDSVFFIQDSILSSGFVSDNFSRQLCSRIVDTYNNWNNYLNNLLMPNPGFLPFQTEAKIFSSEEDKQMIWDLIKNAIRLTSMNSLVIVNKDKILEKKFIDESYNYWKSNFQPCIEKIMKRVHEAWGS